MKRLLSVMGLCCFLFTGCVVGLRSNMNFINHKNHATNEASIRDFGGDGNGSPAVNADKNYEDLLNGSGNGNGKDVNREQKKEESKKEEAAPADDKEEPASN